MDGPGTTSSDILGIELGQRVIRGVRLDQHRAELTAVAECGLLQNGLSADGIVDISVVGPSLEDLLARLKVTDRSQFRIGFSVGPRNSGVGSGPAMAGWLEQQALNLRENMHSSGGLGVAFVPSRAVDAVIKLSRDSGIDLARLDLAPVAAARAIGIQTDERICLGSGHGWQARMRDLEVLEAKENLAVGPDDPMTLVDTKGNPRSLERYGWVDMSDGLVESGGINMSQMAVAVGVAIGIAYGSPADLLRGRSVPGEPDESAVDPALAYLADYDVSPESATESTLRLQPVRPSSPSNDVQAKREPVESPQSTASAIRRVPASALPAVEAVTETVAPEPRPESELMHAAVASSAGSEARPSQDSDRITMFSPDTEVKDMMGRRDRHIAVDAAAVLLILAAIAATVYYLVL